MKKLLSTLVIMGILGSMAAYAAEIEKGYVSTSATAEKEFSPNVASVVLYINTENKDLERATKLNKETSEKVLSAIKPLIDQNSGETIQNINFSAKPEYSYNSNVKTFLHYKVTNGFRVKVKNIEKIGKIMAQGLNNGANKVEDLNYSLDNTQNACNALIEEAAKISKERAKSTALAAGGNIAGIKSISASCNNNENNYKRYGMYSNINMSADTVSESTIPVEAGTIKLWANVSSQYFVK